MRKQLCTVMESRGWRCTHCGLLFAAIAAALAALVLDIVGPAPGLVLVLMVVMAVGLALPCGVDLVRRALQST